MRLVSILNVLSKILERAAHSQLSEYLEKRDLLFENQSRFRGGYSTDSCLIGLTEVIRSEIGKGNLVGMVLIDLQKAFDTVDHALHVYTLLLVDPARMQVELLLQSYVKRNWIRNTPS